MVCSGRFRERSFVSDTTPRTVSSECLFWVVALLPTTADAFCFYIYLRKPCLFFSATITNTTAEFFALWRLIFWKIGHECRQSGKDDIIMKLGNSCPDCHWPMSKNHPVVVWFELFLKTSVPTCKNMTPVSLLQMPPCVHLPNSLKSLHLGCRMEAFWDMSYPAILYHNFLQKTAFSPWSVLF